MLLVFASFGFSVNVSAANRFQWITSTDFVTISYDTQSVKYYSEHGKVVDVWTSWEYTDNGARKWVKEARAMEIFQNIKWDNFSRYLKHELMSKNSSKLLEIVYYDVNGNVIESIPFDENAKL